VLQQTRSKRSSLPEATTLRAFLENADLSAFPAAHGRADISDACKALKMGEQRNRALLFYLFFWPGWQ
jgi:hypothetical protein